MYYVYVYLDPRKLGRYQYPNLQECFLAEPFYIGKGSGRRYKIHLTRLGKYETNKYKYNKIQSILSEKLTPYILIYEYDSEEEALANETLYITKIGRFDLNTGPLTNLKDSGIKNSNLSDLSRALMRKAKLGLKWTLQQKQKRSLATKGTLNHFYGKHHSIETKEKISNSRKGKRVGIEHPMFGKSHTKETCDKMRKAKLGLTGLNSPRSFYYKIESPTGKVFEVFGGIYNWCKIQKIPTWKYLKETLTGRRTSYMGWRLLEMKPVSQIKNLLETQSIILSKETNSDTKSKRN